MDFFGLFHINRLIKKVFNFLMDAIQPVVDFISKIAEKIGGFSKENSKKT